MFLVPLLFAVLVICFIFTALNPHHYNNNGGYDSGPGYGTDKSLQILRERYARGEITDEEYEKIKRNLER